jgi:hypothetical protein
MEVALDPVGAEFHDQVTVELEALRAAAKAWRLLDADVDVNGYAVEITDHTGQLVLTIPFSDALKAEPAS